jgi:hypothetical protein
MLPKKGGGNVCGWVGLMLWNDGYCDYVPLGGPGLPSRALRIPLGSLVLVKKYEAGVSGVPGTRQPSPRAAAARGTNEVALEAYRQCDCPSVSVLEN